MQKKVWINKDDIILISLRNFQDDKADVIHKFNPDEIQELKRKNQLPSKSSLNDQDEEGDDDDDCVFSFDAL